MARIKLTKTAVERLPAPDPSGKQVLHLDTQVPGFGVLCSGTTDAKSYVAQKRMPNKLLRRVTIGNVAHFKLDKARARARELLVDMAKGIDPIKEKKIEKEKQEKESKSTLRATLVSYFENKKNLRPRAAEGYKLSVQKHLAVWLDRPLGQISRDMVAQMHIQIGKRAGPAAANSAMRTFRLLYNHAMDSNSSLEANPVRRFEWFPNVVRERLVRNEDLRTFYAAVDALPSRTASDYIKLLLFTGLRRREAAALTWAEVDLTARLIRLPATRTKAKRKLDLPMTTFVRDLLVARRALGDDGPFVFGASSKSGHIEEPKFPLRLVAKQTGIEISAHDLRRTYITAAEACDISPLALKALVNHALGKDVTSSYVQMTTERLREPAQRVCDKLVYLCGIEAFAGATRIG